MQVTPLRPVIQQDHSQLMTPFFLAPATHENLFVRYRGICMSCLWRITVTTLQAASPSSQPAAVSSLVLESPVHSVKRLLANHAAESDAAVIKDWSQLSAMCCKVTEAVVYCLSGQPAHCLTSIRLCTGRDKLYR